MKLFFLFFFKYLFSSRAGALVRFVSVICILGLMVSLSSLIVVISVMSGFGLSIRDRLLSYEPHLVVMGKDKQTLSLSRVQKILGSVGTKDNIKSIRSFETQDVLLKSEEGQFIGAVGRGYFSQDLQAIARHFEKSYFSDAHNSVEWDFSLEGDAQSSVFISSDLAQQLSVFEGNKIFIIPSESLLAPVTELSSPEEAWVYSVMYPSHPSQNLSKSIYYKIGSMPSLKNTASLSQGIEIFLKDPDQFLIYQRALEEQSFKVESWNDRNSALFFALKLEKAIMAVFLFLAALIASFSIISMMRLLLTQKKKDIGILLIMGWSVKKVRRLFLGISFMMSLIGLLGGVLLALLVCLFLQYSSIPFLPDIYYDRQLPVSLNPYVFIWSSLGAVVLAYIASWIPIYSYSLSSAVDLIRRRPV